MTTLRDLPEDEGQLLHRLREENNLPLLRARVRLLRDAGWTLAAVGKPLEANRSTTRMWELSANSEDFPAAQALAPVPEFIRPPAGSRVIRRYPDVPADERDELRELADQARSVRGWTPEDAPARVAARKLEKKLIKYDEQGVPLKRLAEHMGVTHRAVAARIERAHARDAVAPAVAS